SVAHKPTGAAKETAMNRTRNVLPMSSVRSVTHVAGGTHRVHGTTVHQLQVPAIEPGRNVLAYFTETTAE
ncbi:MAG TPA: hypothetical protein VH684_29120, partial [Xanthobacteraceae bacterium]